MERVIFVCVCVCRQSKSQRRLVITKPIFIECNRYMNGNTLLGRKSVSIAHISICWIIIFFISQSSICPSLCQSQRINHLQECYRRVFSTAIAVQRRSYIIQWRKVEGASISLHEMRFAVVDAQVQKKCTYKSIAIDRQQCMGLEHVYTYS